MTETFPCVDCVLDLIVFALWSYFGDDTVQKHLIRIVLMSVVVDSRLGRLFGVNFHVRETYFLQLLYCPS